MNHYYKDLLDPLGNPKWWDEHAVPRYCEFSPDEIANIYADEVVFMEIACQSCGRVFKVAMSESRLHRYLSRDPDRRLQDDIEDGTIHYGDPPNIHCCPAGPTMNCLDYYVFEFWKRENMQWVRCRELEGKLNQE